MKVSDKIYINTSAASIFKSISACQRQSYGALVAPVDPAGPTNAARTTVGLDFRCASSAVSNTCSQACHLKIKFCEILRLHPLIVTAVLCTRL